MRKVKAVMKSSVLIIMFLASTLAVCGVVPIGKMDTVKTAASSLSGAYFSVEPVPVAPLTNVNSSTNGLETPATPYQVGQSFTVEIHLRNATVTNLPTGVCAARVHLYFGDILNYCRPTGSDNMIDKPGGIINSSRGITFCAGLGFIDNNNYPAPMNSATQYTWEAGIISSPEWNGNDGIVAKVFFQITAQPMQSMSQQDFYAQLRLNSIELLDQNAYHLPFYVVDGTLHIESAPVPRPGLVGYWKFDEGSGNIAYDSSGNGNDGVIHDATWTTGVSGSALHFNGVDSWVEVPCSLTLTAMSQITLEAWVQEDSITAQLKGIISKCDGYAPPTNAEYSLGTNENGEVFFETDNGVAIFSSQTTPLITRAGQWYHVAGTWSGNSYAIYVNGQPVLSGTCTPQMTLSNMLPVQIGRHGSWYFQGTIDEVKIYNYARTANDIMSDYSAFVPAPWWNMDWPSRRLVQFSSSNIQDLTDYALPLTIPYENTMRTDFGDIRFVSYDSTTNTQNELSYWIQEKTDGVSAKVWIKIPLIRAQSSGQVYMYYGNSQVTATSNGKTTFWFFDDFNSGDYVSDGWEAWNSWGSGGQWVEHDSVVDQVGQTSGDAILSHQIPEISSYEMQAKAQPLNWTNDAIEVGSGDYHQPNHGHDMAVGLNWNDIRYWGITNSTGDGGPIGQWTYIEGPIELGQWYTFRLVANGTAYGWISDASGERFVGSPNGVSPPITGVYLKANPMQNYASYDWIFVRKYVFPEPTCTLGSQETAPPLTASVAICPETLNLNSNGQWVTGYIELPEGTRYNVSDISVPTISLNDTVSAELNPTVIGDFNNNGVPDLMVKFNRTKVVQYIVFQGIVFANVSLNITGLLNDGQPFEGNDTVKVSSLVGDVDCDGKVDLGDLVALALAYGSTPTKSNWNPNADMDGDGLVGLADLVTLAMHYGEHYP